MYLRCFFFFNDTATTEIYTLSLHDALPISGSPRTGSPHPDPFGTILDAPEPMGGPASTGKPGPARAPSRSSGVRSEEHTSELQSRQYLVCRLLLEKKKNTNSDYANLKR